MKIKNTIWVFSLIIVGLLTFTGSCKKEHVSIVPSVTTTAVSTLQESGATSGGNVTSDGGSAVIDRGVCWSTGATPTIGDSKTSDDEGHHVVVPYPVA